MRIIPDLRQRHLSAWTRALRELKPDGVEDVKQLPLVEFDDVTVRAAIAAGWIEGVSDPDAVGDMYGHEVDALSTEIWQRFNDARRPPDPN